MNQILLVSNQSQYLAEIIKSGAASNKIMADVLPEVNLLFSKLTGRAYKILAIDLELLNRVSQVEPFFVQIESVSPQTAVLVLATPAQRAQAVKQLKQGAVDYLLFPIEPEELLFKIEREFGRLGQPDVSFSHARGDNNDLLMLNNVTREILRTLQLDEALEIVLKKTRQITGADLVKIWLTGPDGKLRPSTVLVSGTLQMVDSGEQEILFSFARHTAQTGKFIFKQNSSEPKWPLQTLSSILLLPLFSRDELTAVLAVGYRSERSFSINQIQWLTAFCQQAAIAIENANLFLSISSAYDDLDQSRKEILRSRNTLQTVFDGISDGLYILNEDLTINALNQIEAKRQGYKHEDLIGKSYLLLDEPKNMPQLVSQIKKSLDTGQEATWISTEKQDPAYLTGREFKIYPICNSVGQVEQAVIFAQSVSERRRWQASLFKSANLASVGRLAGSVAHQINNPLTVTMTNSQLLMYDFDPATEAYDLARGIFNAGKRISGSVENLLEFSNQDEYYFMEKDLIDTIESACALIHRPLMKARIEVIRAYHTKPTIFASVSHLKLLWVNLLLNARDAVDGFAANPKIIIATSLESDDTVKVKIIDNGVGLPEKYMSQIFDPFFTIKPPGKALGLGLYSAQAIVERHKGQIKVYSEPGVSTTFEVILPLSRAR